METDRKLVQACSGLGLNLLEISKFVQISEFPRIACWGYDLQKKENFIFVNPKVLRFPVEHVQLILKHEILHYAGYRSVEYARDYDKVNISLDVVINKILTMAQAKEMKSLCRKIYSEETKKTILCLARPDVQPYELDGYKRQWLNIWNNKEVPSPASLYYQITKPVRIPDNPFGVIGLTNAKTIFRNLPDSKSDGKFTNLTSKIIKNLSENIHGNGFSSAKFSALFKEIFVNKKSFDAANVEEFILKLESRQKLEETSARIISALDNRSNCQLYPYELSRLGIIYIACGISDKVPIFWNKTPESRKNRLAIYVDTSPSMECYQEKEVFLMDKLKSYFPTKIYCFANEIEEVSVKDFAEGIYREGYSTSFDSVIEHLIDSEFDAGVIFTDGYSSVNSENEDKFRQSRKRLFTIYFSESEKGSSDLDGLSEQTMTVSLD